jgi:small redox-active disulfide protein 2
VEYLTVSQAAERLQLSVPTIKRYIYDGRLESTKLPGGQHRIPESEIDRLLAPDGADQPADPTQEKRIEVLERWVTELEDEIERLSAALDVMSRYCGRGAEDLEDADPPAAAQVQVLGPGCRRCEALHELAGKVLREMGETEVALEHVTELEHIVAWGPVITPALVVNGEMVLTGRVPSEDDLRALLREHLG